MEKSWKWALFAGLLVSLVAAAQSVSADLRGIYIYTNDVSQISNATASQLTQSFSIPGIDGVAIVIGWNALEPSLGHYQWTVLNQWISQASALGKKIDLVVLAGSSTPAWVFQPPPTGAGAVDLNFTITPHAGVTGVCDTIDVAPPWDPAFLAQWDSMLAALSAHLKSAGTYNAITLVRLTGINRTSEELRLPAETAASTGLACVSNSIATWRQAGYRPSLLLQGWNSILGSFMKSFPDKSFAVSIIPNNAFPGIDQNGAAIAGTIGDENDPLIMSAATKLPNRLVVQFDFLMPGDTAAAQVVDDSNNLGTLIAFQTNEYLGGQGAGCAEPITSTIPCTAATYITMLNAGIYPRTQSSPLRAQYIEVFHANASAFPADIQQAHYELIPIDSKNAASYSTAPLAPDMIAYGEASNVANGLVIAPDGPWPPTLGGARLDITDSTGQTRPALLYYVTPTQISYLIPSATALGPASIKLTTSNGPTITDGFQVQRISPGLFTANASGSGVPAGFWIRASANGSQTQGYLFDPTQAVGSRTPLPVDLGASTDRVYLSLYGTGFRGATQVTATVGGTPVSAAFAAVGGYQGEDVVNVGPLPRSLAGQGAVSVIVNFDGNQTNPVTVSIR